MSFLLDTHIALWSIVTDPRLSAAARQILTTPGSELFVSIASLWEIAIKRSKFGAVTMPISAAEAEERFLETGYAIAPIKRAHISAVEELPRHHGDPFDRLLIATALSEPLRFLTYDQRLAAYGPLVTVV